MLYVRTGFLAQRCQECLINKGKPQKTDTGMDIAPTTPRKA